MPEPAGPAEPAEPAEPELAGFTRLVGTALGVPADRLDPSDRLGVDVPLDELSLARLVLALQDANPWFELPEQLGVTDITLADLHHFHRVMGPGHGTR